MSSSDMVPPLRRALRLIRVAADQFNSAPVEKKPHQSSSGGGRLARCACAGGAQGARRAQAGETPASTPNSGGPLELLAFPVRPRALRPTWAVPPVRGGFLGARRGVERPRAF